MRLMKTKRTCRQARCWLIDDDVLRCSGLSRSSALSRLPNSARHADGTKRYSDVDCIEV